MNQQVSQSNMQAQLTEGTGGSGGHDRRGDGNRRNDRHPKYNHNKIGKRQRCRWCGGFGHIQKDCPSFNIYRFVGELGIQLEQQRRENRRQERYDRGRGRGRGFSFGQQRGGYHNQHHQYNNQVQQQQQFPAIPANNQQPMLQAEEQANTPATVQPDAVSAQQAIINIRAYLLELGMSEEDIRRIFAGQQPLQEYNLGSQNGR